MEIVFSGAQPSGTLHIGNYLGAIKNWIELQESYRCFFCIVDLHAITVPRDPEELSKKTIEVAKTYLAAGLDPKKSIIFIQSHVKEHAELAWILNTLARLPEMERMTQYKEKAKEHKKDVNLGLFCYPVLMAADILLYKTNVVPVGEDQAQHVELTRDLAQRFNFRFGEIFVVPRALIKKSGARIMSLIDPTKKMSKSSANGYDCIFLTDSPELIREKIKKAVTDSGREILFRADKPALSNLLQIYSLLANKEIKELEKMYQGKNYVDFKQDLAEVVIDFLKPFQTRYNALNDSEVWEILQEGAAAARRIASQTLTEVKKAIGLLI